jgi:threonine aldolase
LTGLFHKTVPGTRGAPDLDALRELINTPSVNSLGTALVCVETTHNSAGGAVIPLAHLAKLRALTGEKGIPLHIDGARVFNAAVKLDVPASEIAKHADSIVFCVSKGLSAPFGSVLCGSEAFVDRARAFRRMVGGAMRQAGIMAAAGVVALEQMVDRLADDHGQAGKLAKGIHAIDRALVEPQSVESNIVMIDVSRTGGDAKVWLSALAAQGLQAGAWTPTQLRLVTHRHIDDAAVDGAIAAFHAVSAQMRPSLAAVR